MQGIESLQVSNFGTSPHLFIVENVFKAIFSVKCFFFWEILPVVVLGIRKYFVSIILNIMTFLSQLLRRKTINPSLKYLYLLNHLRDDLVDKFENV